tara:strand:+ start:6147 stop:7058 length:912 start_codon:yes stop_codon:yes gene_type:complete
MKNIKKKILIVGGTGFIGYHLAKKCLKKNWKVTSISSKPPKKIRYLRKVKYLICDITNKKKLKKKIKNYFDYVVNLGGHVDHSNKKKTYNSHYIGCKNLTEILLKNPPKQFLQMGSSGEYGLSKSPHKEISSTKPKSIYGKSKLLSSLYLKKIFKKKKFPIVILRLYQAYGPKQDLNRFLPIIINGCLKNKKFPCSDGKQFRDFVYVDDVISAINKSLQTKSAVGNIINIGSGKPKNIKKIIYKIKNKIKGGNPEFGKIKLRKDESLKIYPNIKKAKTLLNWRPKIVFDKGLKETIRYYYEQS